MTKRANAKYKIDRRMGENIWGRPKSPVNKREYGPGQHGQRRKGKMSDFGTQLKAKQKLKGYYANSSARTMTKRSASRATRRKTSSACSSAASTWWSIAPSSCRPFSPPASSCPTAT
jgi:small subunit ribosomal protein S4